MTGRLTGAMLLAVHRAGRRRWLHDRAQGLGEFMGGLDHGGHQGARPGGTHAQRRGADQQGGDDLARGVAHRGADGDGAGNDLGIGDQEAALANPVQIGRDPFGVDAGGGGVALQPLGQHLSLHRFRRMGQQQPSGPGVQRHFRARLCVDPQRGVGLMDRDGLGFQAIADPQIDVFPCRGAQGGEVRQGGGGQRALSRRGLPHDGPPRAKAPDSMSLVLEDEMAGAQRGQDVRRGGLAESGGVGERLQRQGAGAGESFQQIERPLERERAMGAQGFLVRFHRVGGSAVLRRRTPDGGPPYGRGRSRFWGGPGTRGRGLRRHRADLGGADRNRRAFGEGRFFQERIAGRGLLSGGNRSQSGLSDGGTRRRGLGFRPRPGGGGRFKLPGGGGSLALPGGENRLELPGTGNRLARRGFRDPPRHEVGFRTKGFDESLRVARWRPGFRHSLLRHGPGFGAA